MRLGVFSARRAVDNFVNKDERAIDSGHIRAGANSRRSEFHFEKISQINDLAPNA
jgi:hypothetical protein